MDRKIGLGIAFGVVLGIAAPAVAQQAVQWRVEDGGNGHWYRFAVANEPLEWNDAKTAAEAVGGHLATLTSQEESEFVFGVVSDPAGWYVYVGGLAYCVGPWLGGFQPSGSSEPAGGWRWVTGEPFAFQRWWWIEPNDGCGGEAFLHLLTQGSTAPSDWWNDGGGPDCPAVVRSYVIEWSADCNADGIVDYGQILDGTYDDLDANGVPDCCEAGQSCIPCPGDVTAGGVVDGTDLAALLSAWGTNGQGKFTTDLNDDGTVDAGDLSIVLAGWGPCPN